MILDLFFKGYFSVIKEVSISLLPLMVIFVVYQLIFRKFRKRQLIRVVTGVAIAFVGLTLFLQGVNVGYIHVGAALGENIASLPGNWNWLLLPIGAILGFTVTLAEPSVHVLVQEIDRVTMGSLPKRTMLITLCIGVAVSIALSMLKTLLHFSLWYFIVPGYIIAIALAYVVPPQFTSIAFDSGGVATGTMTATFLLSLSIGAANQMEHADPMLDGFGLIGLVAMIPTLLVQVLGLIYKMQGVRAARLHSGGKDQEKDFHSTVDKGTIIADLPEGNGQSKEDESKTQLKEGSENEDK